MGGDGKMLKLGWVVFVLMLAAVATAAAQTKVTNSNNGATNTAPMYTGSATLSKSPISVSGGNVGIGTTAPVSNLTVGGRTK